MRWQDCNNDKEKYQLYLQSREWSEKRSLVKKRSCGDCERCRMLRSDHVHHLTYIRKYNELLEDLQDICKPCHEYIHGWRNNDPCSLPASINAREEFDRKRKEEIKRQEIVRECNGICTRCNINPGSIFYGRIIDGIWQANNYYCIFCEQVLNNISTIDPIETIKLVVMRGLHLAFMAGRYQVDDFLDEYGCDCNCDLEDECLICSEPYIPYCNCGVEEECLKCSEPYEPSCAYCDDRGSDECRGCQVCGLSIPY